MIDMLPKEITDALRAAREVTLKRESRLCVHDGEEIYRIRRIWEDGFAIDAADGDKLRGRVEIYSGVRHLYQCLIISSRLEGNEMIFDFKWIHPVATQPAADFVRETPSPIGLLPSN